MIPTGILPEILLEIALVEYQVSKILLGVSLEISPEVYLEILLEVPADNFLKNCHGKYLHVMLDVLPEYLGHFCQELFRAFSSGGCFCDEIFFKNSSKVSLEILL